jgi:hypothetical protein
VPSQTTRVISGTVAPVKLPFGMVFVAQGWCNVLVVALLLDLPILAIFIEARVARLLGPLLHGKSLALYVLAEVTSIDLPFPLVVVVSGSITFYARLRDRLKYHDYVMWVFQQGAGGSNGSML